MTMDFDMSKIAEEIVMQAKENQDEFIIETIFPFCEDVLQIKIDKEKLKQILLNDIQKPQSCEDCIISREDAIRIAEQGQVQGYEWQFKKLCNLPSVTSKAESEEEKMTIVGMSVEGMALKELKYVDEEDDWIMGYNKAIDDAIATVNEWLSSFNTESATKCFIAVQELKKLYSEEVKEDE